MTSAVTYSALQNHYTATGCGVTTPPYTPPTATSTTRSSTLWGLLPLLLVIHMFDIDVLVLTAGRLHAAKGVWPKQKRARQHC